MRDRLRVLSCVALLVVLTSCGARSSVLAGAGAGDADADSDADADADADVDADADADAEPPPCGDGPGCGPGQMCCVLERCIDVGTCCAHDDCGDGLACVPLAGAAGRCGVGDLGCGLEELAVEPIPPNMVILLDRSSSMAQLIDGERKWDVALAALDLVLTEYDDRVRFGLAMFPGAESSCTPAVVDVPVGDATAFPILEVLSASGPLQTTPIGASLEDLRRGAGLDDPDRRNLVLLVSDGQESCGGAPVVATQHLHDEDPSVSVYVVGFGTQVDDAMLSGIADAGRTARPGRPSYWVAEDQQALADALTAIIRSVVPCGFALGAFPPDPEHLWVWLDSGTGVARDRSHQDGWDLEADTNVLTFYGPACETIRTDQHRVRVVFGCRNRGR